jgi:hypothetical protein
MVSRPVPLFAEAPAGGCSRTRSLLLAWAVGLLWPCAIAAAQDAQEQIHWRVPDHFVVPAAGAEQEQPTSTLPDDPEPLNQNPARPAPPASHRAAPSPVAAAHDQAMEPDDGAYDVCPPNRCETCRPWLCRQPFANRLEVRAEWLLWWGKGNAVPPLVTTGPTSQSPAEAGVPGAPGTAILFGNSDLNDASRSGGRVTLDYWLTCDHSLALEAQYFGLGDNTETFAASNNSDPILARPFVNVATLADDAGLIAYPGLQTGNIKITATTDFQGADVLLRRPWLCGQGARLDFLVGYRYLRLSDDLNFTENDTFINPSGLVPVGSTLNLVDHFSTLNEFQGADLGLATDWHCCNWSLGFLLKVGLGSTNSHVTIDGSTTATEPATPPLTATYPGGFLAQTSNSGVYERSQFTVVPELGVNLGYDLTPRLRLVAGYTLIYWSGVVRTGDQIDLNLTPPQFAPPQTTTNLFPQFHFVTTDYWAQGLNLGLDFRF